MKYYIIDSPLIKSIIDTLKCFSKQDSRWDMVCTAITNELNRLPSSISNEHLPTEEEMDSWEMYLNEDIINKMFDDYDNRTYTFDQLLSSAGLRLNR